VDRETAHQRNAATHQVEIDLGKGPIVDPLLGRCLTPLQLAAANERFGEQFPARRWQWMASDKRLRAIARTDGCS
jgi:hypothetical protein